MSTDADLLLRQTVQAGGLIESVSEMTEEYKRELRHIVTVSGDTEPLSAPAYYYAARKAPSVNSMISAMAIIQDELAHAHMLTGAHARSMGVGPGGKLIELPNRRGRRRQPVVPRAAMPTVACVFCGSADTEPVSIYGCLAQYYCVTCRTSFDWVRDD